MKKKGAFLAILLAGAMTLGVAAAGCKKKPDEGKKDPNEAVTPNPSETTDPGNSVHKHVGSGSWTVEEANKPTGTSAGLATRNCVDNDGGKESKTLPALSDSRYAVKATSTYGISRYTITIDGVSISFTTTTYVKPVDPSEEEPDKPVVLTSDTAISLTVGDVRELNGPDANTTWTSDKETVATVDSNGKVSAKTAGVAKIKAKSGNTEVTCTVIVLAPLTSGGSETVTKDPFKATLTSKDIGSVEVSGSPTVSDPNASEYKVTFTDGVTAQYVAKDGLAIEPVGVESDGKYLLGWKKNGASDYFDFNNTPVQENLSLTSVWADLPSGIESVVGHEESISVEWSDSNAAGATVAYTAHGTSDWKAIDSQLIRQVSSGDARADILGLAAGRYDVKVTLANNSEKTIENVKVNAYDRNGYAHFKYDEGVGAYNDDGTLKENALVIYVTDENKDSVMDEVCAANSDVNMFKIPHYTGANAAGKDWGDKTASGIGWWLNNNQYTSSNAGSSKNKRPSNTYDPVNGSKLAFKSVNRPIVIRFIGTVTTPEGCTNYNDPDEGGGVGDNGHMARLKNLKNITLEGVGDDAEIKGWGFHFVAGTDAVNGEGKSFEVRNLTFNEYPEDAIGMEGQATSSKITAPVERCWIHNNTFLPGYCKTPAESDKKEGDGSCDFKRGYYFTCSYNYFEYCHKTNLIGSADDSLQYNMTYHHNIWYQCGSRIPLTRQANVHFYNNYVFGDPAEKNTPYQHIDKPSLSYVHSLRANCYLFSENNYYEGCKNILRGSEGGDGKFYGNTYYACSDTKTPVTDAESRLQTVPNKSKDPTTGTSYATFDTDPNLFYFDKANGKTDALLDDSLGARIRAVLYAGAQGHYNVTKKLQQMNTSPASSTTEITSSLKGKGQVVTFSVAANTTLTIDASGEDPQVIRNDGKVYLAPFSGQKIVMLDEGTYMVCSGKKDKEITINSMKVQEDSEAAKQARIEAAKTAIQNIPASITRSSGSVIEQAASAYSNLIKQEERDAISAELTSRLKKAQAAYDEILVSYAIDRINYIGTVTEQSGNDITLAAKAYSAVSSASRSKVTNYDKLAEAQAEFTKFAVQNVQSEISRLPKTADFPSIVDSKPAIELALEIFNDALDAYGDLEDEDKPSVNVTGVSAAIETLTAALKPFDVKDMIASLPASTATDYISKAGALKTAYEALTADQKTLINEEEKAIYDEAVAAYNDYASKAKLVIITSDNDSKLEGLGFTISGSKSYRDKSNTFVYNGTTYNSPLKVQSDTVVSFSTASEMTVKIMLHSSKKQSVNVDGEKVTATDGIITVKLAAGNHTIGKSKDGESWLCCVELLPA